MADTTILDKDKPFLEKVKNQANLPDIFDARDITVVVFRTMRDLMTTKASDQIAEDLHKKASSTEQKGVKEEIADLWKDTNPLVAFLSRIRPPLTIDSQIFLRRINQEAGLPRGVDAKTVIKAIFSATKDELSPERIQEISSYLPEQIRQIWDQA
jgi:uncharacterized protein (DUF2267 family)